jgi:hypothetical protein
MPFFLGLIFLIGVGFAAKTAFEDLRGNYRASRGRAVKAAEDRAAPGGLSRSHRSSAVRNHAAGYWSREAAHGFPVTRTGWHAGWLAHKSASDHQRAVREEARTTQLETRAAFIPAIRDHRARQAEARRQIAEGLAREPSPAGKKAVQTAASNVRLFPPRTPPQDPPLPSERVAPVPGPYAAPPRRADDQPENGERPHSPQMAKLLGTDTPEGAARFDRMSALRDSGYTGPIDQDGNKQADTQSNPSPAWRRPRASSYGAWRADDINERWDDPLPSDTQSTPSPATNGAAPMSRGPAEQTYDQTIQDSNDIIRDCEQELARLKARKITQKLEQLASSGLDPANLGRASDIDDALKEQEKAAQKALDTSQSFRDGLQRDHGGMNESHQSAPVKGAQPEFYEG